MCTHFCDMIFLRATKNDTNNKLKNTFYAKSKYQI